MEPTLTDKAVQLDATGYGSSQSQINILDVSGYLNRSNTYTELRMPDGKIVRLPTALLETRMVQPGGAEAMTLPAELSEDVTIPLVEEQLTVGKRTVTTGKVRLVKTTQEYEEALNEPLAVRTYDIERVILNRAVESVPEIRHEGHTTIYPLVEEQLILTKQLILKEEVHVTKRDTERVDTQVVTLKRENLIIEREPGDGSL